MMALAGIKLGSGAAGEAHVGFQHYVLSLKERGVILAVCSKNEEDVAKAPSINTPIRYSSSTILPVFRANWQNKPTIFVISQSL